MGGLILPNPLWHPHPTASKREGFSVHTINSPSPLPESDDGQSHSKLWVNSFCLFSFGWYKWICQEFGVGCAHPLSPAGVPVAAVLDADAHCWTYAVIRQPESWQDRLYSERSSFKVVHTHCISDLKRAFGPCPHQEISREWINYIFTFFTCISYHLLRYRDAVCSPQNEDNWWINFGFLLERCWGLNPEDLLSALSVSGWYLGFSGAMIPSRSVWGLSGPCFLWTMCMFLAALGFELRASHVLSRYS
jgi:hypothetical protein